MRKGIHRELQPDLRPAPLLRSSTMKAEGELASPLKLRFISPDKGLSGLVGNIHEDIVVGELGEENSDVSMNYKIFAKRNIFNIDILNIYCDELANLPYEDNMQNDLTVGRWLDEIIPSLSQELFPLMQEVARFRIDTSTLDIYKNMLISIGKRYELTSKIMVITPSSRILME